MEVVRPSQAGPVAERENELGARGTIVGRGRHPPGLSGPRELFEDHDGTCGPRALTCFLADAKEVVSTAVWMIPEILPSTSRIGW